MSRLVALLAFALATPVSAQHSEQHFPDDSKLSELIQTRVEEGRAPGIVVGVLEADGTERFAAFGKAGEGALPISVESIFEIGSITKAFTGILLAETSERSTNTPTSARVCWGTRSLTEWVATMSSPCGNGSSIRWS